MFTSLQRKLLSMILAAAIICIGIMGWSWYQSHFGMLESVAKERLATEAVLIDQLTRQALVSRDATLAGSLLEKTLAADENFHAIHLLLPDYSRLASVGDPVIPRLWLKQQEYGHKATAHHMLHPVLVDGQPVGYVLIELDPLVMVEDKEAAFYVMSLTMMISLLFAIGIFIVYRNQVSQPLSHVADRMRELLESDPLSQWMDAGFCLDHPGFERIPVDSDDEVGRLVIAFNDLLENLETNFEQVYDRYSEMRSNLDQFREMTEATPIPIVITRIEDGQMLFHNPAALALVEDDRPNPEDKNIAEYYVDPAARRRLRRLLQARGMVSNYEFKARKKSGGRLWLSASVRVIQYRGEPAYLAVLADLTERKQYEDQLRQFNEKLEETIKARTKDLNKARKAAESSSKAKGEFLANMSHEIRTPMNAVIGLAHLVLDTELSTMQRDYIEKILGASEDLLGIINDILDFSKVEAGKMEVENIDFDLSETLEKVASIGGLKAEEKGLSFLLDYPPDMPMHLTGDPLRLKQVLINLVNNAVKFTKEGEIRLSIEPVEEKSGKLELKFSVSDTGIGMGKKELERLFKAFSQADSSTTRKFGGTGLGLAISKRLVELMGGSIQVESRPNQGSIFYFTASFGVDTSSPLKKIRLPAALANMRVLVVDDNPTVSIVLERYLSALGLKAVCAGSAEEGLALLEQQAEDACFELVLMDWKMPGMDGIQASRKIRQSNLVKMPKIILVSAYGGKGFLKEVDAALVDGSLTKPVNLATLADAITTAFGHNSEVVQSQKRQSLTSNIPAQIRGAHLLLAEDNEINLEVAKGLLEKANISVTIARNGKQALDALETERFDGLLMDLQMPVMSGLEAARKIRKTNGYAKLPIIAMTANTMAGDVRACYEAGMNAHVGKPINPQDLYRILGDHIHASNPLSEHEPDGNESVEQAQLPMLPGIDIEEGMLRIGRDAALYRKVLKKFYSNHVDYIARLHEAMTAADQEEALRMAHSLKGASGNVGATDLYQAAAALETCLRQRQQDECRLHLADIEFRMALVLNGLKAWREQQSGDETQAGAGADVLPLLEKMKHLLQQSDSEAADVMDEIDAAIQNSAVGEQVGRLRACIDCYDFESGMSVLRDIEAAVRDGV